MKPDRYEWLHTHEDAERAATARGYRLWRQINLWGAVSVAILVAATMLLGWWR